MALAITAARASFTESDVEQAALAWLESLGWSVAHGPDIAPGVPSAERAVYAEVLLARLNPDLAAAEKGIEVMT